MPAESTKSKIAKNIALSIALVLCVACSIWICYGQVEKYFMEMTLVNTEYVKEDKFPNLLFCPTEGNCASFFNCSWRSQSASSFDFFLLLLLLLHFCKIPLNLHSKHFSWLTSSFLNSPPLPPSPLFPPLIYMLTE